MYYHLIHIINIINPAWLADMHMIIKMNLTLIRYWSNFNILQILYYLGYLMIV